MSKILSLIERLTSWYLGKRLTQFVLIAIVAVIVAVFGTQLALLAKSLTFSAQSESKRATIVSSQHLRFTIYPEGILPATATARSGLISISIEDLADSDGALVERIGEHGSIPLGNVRRFERHWRGRASVKLSPGAYRLRIAKDGTREALLQVEP